MRGVSLLGFHWEEVLVSIGLMFQTLTGLAEVWLEGKVLGTGTAEGGGIG